MYDKYKAFTLVELLIVLSIVAILAMVAAPKMVESELLSKITQVSQDQRLIQSALDAYFQDYGGYPRDHDSRWPYPEAGAQDGFTQLTSPIHYQARLPKDPFGTIGMQTGKPIEFYEGGSGSDEVGRYDPSLTHGACGTGSSPKMLYQKPELRLWGASSCIHAYLIISMGPDQKDSTSGNDEFPYSTTLKSYSPTNGTTSFGDIYRMTGQYRRGNVTLDGISLSSIYKSAMKGGLQS